VLSGRGLCDELITRPEESYRMWCVVVCVLETSRIGAPYIYDISCLRVNPRPFAVRPLLRSLYEQNVIIMSVTHSFTENEARTSPPSDVIVKGTRNMSRSQWPRGLRRGSAAVRLLK